VARRYGPGIEDGAMSNMPMEFVVLDIQTIKHEVFYWPDKKDESGVAQLIVKEDKTQRARERGFI
uniref:hypothetical protein n=1 Tax=Pseudomonas huaxiensis TaxID=2213017 RepID=UPI001CDCD836